MKQLEFSSLSLVEIIGNVASGKTTLAKKLPKVTNLSYIDTDLFENNPFMVPSVQDPKRWVFTEELYFSFLRSKQIPKVLNALKSSPLVLDQGFHMPFYMYTKNRHRQKLMTDKEWAFIEQLHFHLLKDAPIPTVTVFLDVPVKTLFERMNIRVKHEKREHEKLYTKEYLSQLNIGLNEYKEYLIQSQEKESVITFNYQNKSFSTIGKKQNEFIDILKHLLF